MTAEWVPQKAKPCIFEESLAVQRELASTIVYANEPDRERALGAITLTEKTLALHKKQRDCSDLCNGGPVCPVKEWVMFSRASAASVWKPEDIVADLSLGNLVTDRPSREATMPQTRTLGFVPASQHQANQGKEIN